MSTRANIKIISKSGEKIFYQHYDGYPDGLGAVIDKFISEQSQYHNWDPDIISNSLVDGTFGKAWNIKPVDKIAGDVSFVYNIDCTNRTIVVEQWQWVTNEEDILMSVSQFEKIISRKQY